MRLYRQSTMQISNDQPSSWPRPVTAVPADDPVRQHRIEGLARLLGCPPETLDSALELCVRRDPSLAL
jgi:hypothetical protein